MSDFNISFEEQLILDYTSDMLSEEYRKDREKERKEMTKDFRELVCKVVCGENVNKEDCDFRCCEKEGLEKLRNYFNRKREEQEYLDSSRNESEKLGNLIIEDEDFLVCSECGENVFSSSIFGNIDSLAYEKIERYNYCPHCGVKFNRNFTNLQEKAVNKLNEKKNLSKKELESLIGYKDGKLHVVSVYLSEEDNAMFSGDALRVLGHLNECSSEINRGYNVVTIISMYEDYYGINWYGEQLSKGYISCEVREQPYKIPSSVCERLFKLY